MDREATIGDIARLAKVSVATVSRVLNSKCQEKWEGKKLQAEHIRKIARELGYRPNASARAMRNGHGVQISILVNQIAPSPWEYELIEGAMDEFSRHAIQVAIIGGAGYFGARGFPKELETNMFAGLIAINPTENVRRDLDSRPHIWLDSNGYEPTGFINRDELAAGALCMERIAALGHRKALFVGIDRWEGCHHCVIDRESGAADAAKRLGVEFRSVRTQLFKSAMSRYEQELISSVKSGCALIAWNYALASWCVNKAAGHGLCPGKDYPLVCCEETHDTPVIWPELSRVSFDRPAMGAMAANGLMKLIDKRISTFNSTIVKGDWIEGSTCLKAGTGGR